jgi:hypothetical protein
MFRISSDIISQTRQTSLTVVNPPIPRWNWKVKIGNTVNYMGWITNIKGGGFTLATSGQTVGRLDFALFDRPIYYGEDVDIWYNTGSEWEHLYNGFVSNVPDDQGGVIQLQPYLQRLNEVLIDTVYTSKTKSFILNDALTQKSAITGVSYNSVDTDLNDDSTVVISYQFEKLMKIVKDMNNYQSGRYMGVANKFFYIRAFETDITQNIYYDDLPPYEKMTVKTDWKKIKATRFVEVTQKVTTNSASIGEVGTGGSYPEIDLENVIGIKEGKINVPGKSQPTAGLDFAYNSLLAQSVPVTANITNLDYSRKPVHIGQYIRVWTNESLINNTIIDCETTDNWSGDVSTSTDHVEGAKSIQFTADISKGSGWAVYTFPGTIRWRKPEKIGFFIKATQPGDYLEFSWGSYLSGYGMNDYGLGDYGLDGEGQGLWDNVETVFINGVGEWVNIVVEGDNLDTMKYFGIRRKSGNTTDAVINIDNVYLVQYTNKYYDLNVIQIDFNLDSDLVNVKLGEFEERQSTPSILQDDQIGNISETIKA